MSASEGSGAGAPAAGGRVAVGYLGPRGTFSEEALLGSAGSEQLEPMAMETIYDAIMAVQQGGVPLALVPIENSIEGPLTVTLDALATEAADVQVVGELVLAVHHALIAPSIAPLQSFTTVLSHPQASAQCAGFLRRELPGARVAAATSTAEAVRLVAEHREGDWAAIGTRLAAEIYGCVVVCEDIEDRPDNETRFVWLGRAGEGAPRPPEEAARSGTPRKTSIVFWGPGADRAGWLVRCLDEFARRRINLTKIESRPRRERLGHYMFFADLEADAADPEVEAAVSGLRSLCEEVRVLGSYPVAG